VTLGRKAGFVTGEDNVDWPDLWRKVLGGLPPHPGQGISRRTDA
jgi:hypothetical protein